MEMTTELALLLGFLAAGGLLLILGIYIKRILPASGEIRFIESEIENAQTAEARKYWKHELYKVYMTCIFGDIGRKK